MPQALTQGVCCFSSFVCKLAQVAEQGRISLELEKAAQIDMIGLGDIPPRRVRIADPFLPGLKLAQVCWDITYHTPSTSPPGPAATIGPSSSPNLSSRLRHCREFHSEVSVGVMATERMR